MITTLLLIALLICLLLLIIAYRGSIISIHFPWLWANIGQPLFNHFFVVNDKKLMKIYLFTVGSICAVNPLTKFFLGAEVSKGDVVVKTMFGIDTDVIDKWTFGIVLTLSLVLCVYMFVTHRKDSMQIHKPNKTLVVMYAANIANDTPLLSYKMATDALPEDYEPIEGSPLRLQVDNDPDDPEFWEKEANYLENAFLTKILPYMQLSKVNHVSLFSMASMPHLTKLGSLLNEKYSVEVYQKHRNPDNWNKLNECTPDYILNRPTDTTKQPVLVFSLSDKIYPRIKKLYGDNASIWELTVPNPNMDMMRTKKQQVNFCDISRELLSEISGSSNFDSIKIHMAMPIATAVELGRVWMSKSHKALELYDYRNGKENYTITIRDK